VVGADGRRSNAVDGGRRCTRQPRRTRQTAPQSRRVGEQARSASEYAMKSLRVALSIGCPSGVGPEVSVAAAARSEVPCILVGDENAVRRAARIVGVRPNRLTVVHDARAARALDPRLVGIWAHSARLRSAPAPGRPTRAAGAAQLAWID